MLTDLIVFDIATKRTLVMNEHQPTEAIQATRDLDVIVGKLIAGDYVGAEPDPKLVIV
jgi:hypothetical protein